MAVSNAYSVAIPHSNCAFTVAIHYSTTMHACGSSTHSPLMPAIFFVPSVFEFTLFFMTGFRAWQDAKIMTSMSSAPFLTILYRDGIIVFFVTFGIRIWNIWIVRFIFLFHVRLINISFIVCYSAFELHLYGRLPSVGDDDDPLYPRIPKSCLPRTQARSRRAKHRVPLTIWGAGQLGWNQDASADYHSRRRWGDCLIWKSRGPTTCASTQARFGKSACLIPEGVC